MDNPLDNDGLAAQPAPKPAPVAADTPIAEDVVQPKAPGAAKPHKKRSKVGLYVGSLIIVLALAAVGGFFVMQKMMAPQAVSAAPTEEAQGPLKAYVKGSMAHLVTFASPQAMNDMAFIDRDKKAVHLSDFKGQVVVLNLWATWCAPCRSEMPTLASLQSAYAGKNLKVIPLSGDVAEKLDDVKSFIDVQEPLMVYQDPNLIAKTADLHVQGLPATLVLDKQGRMVARLDGSASWDTPEAKALMDKLLAE